MAQISIIVPVYNVAHRLRQCLDSIAGQSFSDFEAVVVDDGSTDASGSICDEYAAADSRFIVFHQQDLGVSVARNRALDWLEAHSDSRWLTFIDSDDVVSKYYLEWLLQANLEQHTKISRCDFRYIQDRTVLDEPSEPAVFTLCAPDDIYCEGEMVRTFLWGHLYERALWQGVRMPPARRWQDLAIYHKVLFAVDKAAVTHTQLYYYYQNEGGAVHARWTKTRLDEFMAYEDALPFIRQHGNRALYRAVIESYLLAIAGSRCLLLGNASKTLSRADRREGHRVIRQKWRSTLALARREGFAPSKRIRYLRLKYLFARVDPRNGLKIKIKQLVKKL